MVDLTILELNLEGAEFTANAPYSGESGSKSKGLRERLGGSEGLTQRFGRSGTGESDSTELTSGGNGGPNPLVAVLAVVIAVVAVAVVRRLASDKEGGERAEEKLRSIR